MRPKPGYGGSRPSCTNVAEGLSNKAISDRLHVAAQTVESHVTQIFLKLGVDTSPNSHRRVLAVLSFLRR
jgi:DNA-binding NarL/FixJ family response regulator